MNIYITLDEIQNEIDLINKEIYLTNLHITGFQNVKNNFNYKCGPHSVEIKYLVDSNKFVLTKKKNFEKDEHVIYIDKVKDLKESLMAVVLNLIEKAITKEAKRILMFSKANEYEEILTVLNRMTEDSSIQEYWNLLITPWLMNNDKSIQERISIEVIVNEDTNKAKIEINAQKELSFSEKLSELMDNLIDNVVEIHNQKVENKVKKRLNKKEANRAFIENIIEKKTKETIT